MGDLQKKLEAFQATRTADPSGGTIVAPPEGTYFRCTPSENCRGLDEERVALHGLPAERGGASLIGELDRPKRANLPIPEVLLEALELLRPGDLGIEPICGTPWQLTRRPSSSSARRSGPSR